MEMIKRLNLNKVNISYQSFFRLISQSNRNYWVRILYASCLTLIETQNVESDSYKFVLSLGEGKSKHRIRVDIQDNNWWIWIGLLLRQLHHLRRHHLRGEWGKCWQRCPQVRPDREVSRGVSWLVQLPPRVSSAISQQLLAWFSPNFKGWFLGPSRVR